MASTTPTLHALLGAVPRERSEKGLRPMAKMNLRKAESAVDEDFREQVGWAIQRAASLLGWSLKELAGHIGRDPRQVARWIAGGERPHVDAIFAVTELRQPFVLALAELIDEGVEVSTTIQLRRVR